MYVMVFSQTNKVDAVLEALNYAAKHKEYTHLIVTTADDTQYSFNIAQTHFKASLPDMDELFIQSDGTVYVKSPDSDIWNVSSGVWRSDRSSLYFNDILSISLEEDTYNVK